MFTGAPLAYMWLFAEDQWASNLECRTTSETFCGSETCKQAFESLPKRWAGTYRKNTQHTNLRTAGSPTWRHSRRLISPPPHRHLRAPALLRLQACETSPLCRPGDAWRTVFSQPVLSLKQFRKRHSGMAKLVRTVLSCHFVEEMQLRLVCHGFQIALQGPRVRKYAPVAENTREPEE
jgi:hypothetical protein